MLGLIRAVVTSAGPTLGCGWRFVVRCPARTTVAEPGATGEVASARAALGGATVAAVRPTARSGTFPPWEGGKVPRPRRRRHDRPAVTRIPKSTLHDERLRGIRHALREPDRACLESGINDGSLMSRFCARSRDWPPASLEEPSVPSRGQCLLKQDKVSPRTSEPADLGHAARFEEAGACMEAQRAVVL
jgi:hypothetical protein